jgi:tRNA(Ile2) C34 agmatinyltransferase TiaS
MEKQIENILIKVDEGTMPVQQALSELLRLFNVSGSVCDECGDGTGWYGNNDLNYNCSKCNPEAN